MLATNPNPNPNPGEPVSEAKQAQRPRTPPGTRDKLIRAASKEFALRGYEGASLESIARFIGARLD